MKTRARRRLAVVLPAAAAILGVTAVQSGAAEACGRWLFGEGSRQTETAQPTKRPAAVSPGYQGKADRVRPRVLVVEDGAELGAVTGRFLLGGSRSLPKDARVVFSVKGPASVSVMDGKAPFAVRIDPRRMNLVDGEYSVSTRVDGQSAAHAVASLTIKAGVRTSKPHTTKAAKPAPTTTRPASDSSTTEAPKPEVTTSQPVPEQRTVTTATRQPAPTSSTTTEAPKPSETATQPKPTATQAPVGGEAAEVVRLTNEQRVANGCPALTVNGALTRAAQGHSEDMAARNYFEHTNLDGLSPFDRMKAAGYSYRMAAENIAAGQRTPQAVVTGWMNSSGHRANILNCGLSEIGVGVAKGGRYGIYWTQNFGTPR